MTARAAPAMALAIACGALGAAAATQDRPQFRAGTSGVAVDVSVTDGRRAVLGLGAADFELVDNGVPQTIAAAALEHIPFDLSLVVDTSGSLTGPLLDRFKQDIAAIGALLRPDDRIRLVTFATRGADAFGWQPGTANLPLTRLAAGGATAFYNTLAAVLLRQTDPGRRHLIVAMSDGYDNVSLLDAPDVRDLARLADAVLHVVIRQPLNTPRRTWGWVPYTGQGDTGALREAAEATGGRFRSVAADATLTAAFKTALDEFRTGYVLWYTPTGVERAGWHTIDVRLKQGRHAVRARKGYDGGR